MSNQFDKELIHKLYPGVEDMLYSPMLIHASTDFQLQKACQSGEYFGQLKKDGAFYQFAKGSNGECYLFGRTVSKKTGLLTEKLANVPQIKEALECLPNKTILIGEIYYPGGSSRNTTEIMGCLPAKAIERQRTGSRGYIHYYIHDIIMYDNVDFIVAQTGAKKRYKILQKIFELYNLQQYNFLELAEVWEDDLYERVGLALDAGEEGMVIKHKDGIYQPGKRPDTNLKAKKTDFADVIITGFEAPTKEYYGKDIESWQYWIVNLEDSNIQITTFLPIGCHYGEKNAIAVTKPYWSGWYNARIKIGAYNSKGEIENIGTIHSGISDEMKENMSKHPEKYLNHVVKIQMMEVDKTNHTIRHGFFISIREDKPNEDCTINSIFD